MSDAARSAPTGFVAPLLVTLVSLFERALHRNDPEDRLALETIEAMARHADQNGRITRLRASRIGSTAARCPDCGLLPAKAMSAQEVRDVRHVVKLARIDDAVAFAFAKTTVLVTVTSRPSMCRCDLAAWSSAIDEYKRDPASAWRSLGVLP